MKKYFITFAILLGATYVSAQTEFEALRYVQTDIIGTARYMSMGGAFGALGGDASSLRDNPAGLGIYRRSELTGTLGFNMQNASADWLGNNATNDSYRITGNNLSLIMSNQTWRGENGKDGLIHSNFAFSYNRVKDFNRNVSIRGNQTNNSFSDYLAVYTNGLTKDQVGNYPWDDSNIPWLSIMGFEGYLIDSIGVGNWSSSLQQGQKVLPGYKLIERGHVDEYSFGWGGNFNNFFYLGATLNYQSIDYQASTIYSESTGNSEYLNLANNFSTKGSGFNLRIGGIVQPTDFLRLGVSFQTPTIMRLNEVLNSTLRTNTYNGYHAVDAPYSNYSNFPPDYQIQGPLQLNLSSAFIFGHKGLLSLEYDMINYTGTRLRDNNSDADEFYKENQGVKQNFNNSATLKIGGEYKLSDNFSLRAGFANVSAITKNDATKNIRLNTIRTDTEYFGHTGTNYFSGGFGYREADWYLDFAYVNKRVSENFVPYNSATFNNGNIANELKPAKVTNTTNNIVVTLGFRF